MRISMNSICQWAGTNPAQRNFQEGEKNLRAGHLIKCGITGVQGLNDDTKITAFCLQTTHLRDTPHEINGVITKDGLVKSMVCSCKAGQREKCKHMATLLYCYRNDVEILSCTDGKCSWKKNFNEAMQNYAPGPLEEHKCFPKLVNKYVASEKDVHDIKNQIVSNLQSSGFVKHMFGRHNPVYYENADNVVISDREKKVIGILFKLQQSELMETIKNKKVKDLLDCCKRTQDSLLVDYKKICLESRISYEIWRAERQFRVTGSKCYELFTYSNNKKPDWKKKTQKCFNPTDFKSEYVEYGRETEDAAREAFEKKFNRQVIQTGLIISKQNPWLAYSPDGVVIENGNPVSLLEIKCPFKGKCMSIQEAVKFEFGKCLVSEQGVLTLKKKHKYFGQVQLGLAVLNLVACSFVMYASFDKSLMVLEVLRDDRFILQMLTVLKQTYFTHMIHEVCHIKKSDENNMNVPN